MKRVFNTLMLVLAANCLAIFAGVGWLYSGGKLDHQKITAIREILFPEGAAPAKPAQAAVPSTQPTARLDELLAIKSGRPASEQIESIRTAVAQQLAELDRREREVLQYQQRVEQKNEQVKKAWEEVENERKRLAAQEQEATRLAGDKGFQDSLELYQSMPAKAVKTIFMGLDDKTVIQYLQAMDSTATKRITKEFKAPEEMERLKRVLERMRLPATMARTENGQ